MPEPNQSVPNSLPAGSGTNSIGAIQPGPSPMANQPTNSITGVIPSAENNATSLTNQVGLSAQLKNYIGSDDGEDLYSAMAKLANFTKCDASSMNTR